MPEPRKSTKIAQLLFDRGISSKDAQKAMKINKAHFSLIKNGHQNITMVTLVKLCKFFKVSPNDILDYERWLTESDKKES